MRFPTRCDRAEPAREPIVERSADDTAGDLDQGDDGMNMMTAIAAPDQQCLPMLDTIRHRSADVAEVLWRALALNDALSRIVEGMRSELAAVDKIFERLQAPMEILSADVKTADQLLRLQADELRKAEPWVEEIETAGDGIRAAVH